MSNASILIVDDDDVVQGQLLRWVKRSVQAEVRTARNGLEALERLAEAPPSVVLADLEVGLSGKWSMLPLIRNNPQLSGTIIIATAYKVGLQQVRELIATGVSDLVLKPLRYQNLIPRIEMAIETWRKRSTADSPGELHSLPRVLVADPDETFRELVQKALENHFNIDLARTVGDAISAAARINPQAIVLSTAFPGLRLESFVQTIERLSGRTGYRIYLLVKDPAEAAEFSAKVAGTLLRTTAPAAFRAETAKLIRDLTAAEAGGADWFGQLRQAFPSQVQLVCGSLTSIAAHEIEAPTGESDWLSRGSIQLTEGPEHLRASVTVEAPASTVKAMSCSISGMEEDDLDQELMDSTLAELLNMLGDKVQSAAVGQTELALHPPAFGEEVEIPGDAAEEFSQYFEWGEAHPFRTVVRAYS